MSSTYYITTAIAYTQKKQHIGNVYDPVIADCQARFQRLRGRDVYFLTGTDEHGQKIQKQAEEEGVTPQELVDRMSADVRRQWDYMNVKYDQFIRTTDPMHERAVQNMFKRLYEQGDIYKGAYEGLYCLPCETFYTDTQAGGDKACPSCGAQLQPASEEAYFFKLGKYADRLMKHIEEHPDFIQPVSRRNEMIENFLKPGLQDLCVSRTSFTWGIPVTFDPGHVVYVWLDALSNYITALGYDPGDDGTDPQKDAKFKKYWPAQVHVIGKDILRFHTIYWPIMLMALDVPLPQTVLGHPWLLFGEDKMSKSKGNVLYADELAENFGVDAVRYFLLREIPFAQDASITIEKLVSRINSDLANDLGNLLSRTVSMVEKYFSVSGGVIEPDTAREASELDDQLKLLAEQTAVNAAQFYEGFQMQNALAEIWRLIARANKYIDETMPWILGKKQETMPRLASVLYSLCETLRLVSVLCEPALPSTAAAIREQLGVSRQITWDDAVWRDSVRYAVVKGASLFPRLDLEAELAKYAAPAAAQEPAVEKPEALEEIGIEDFMRVDLRVGAVLSCERIPKSDKLLKFQIDLGYEQRQIVSGIAEYYKPEELSGRRVAVVTNLKTVKLRGVESQGMLLCAEAGDKVVLLETPSELPLGAKIR